jgi:hypothetical protein
MIRSIKSIEALKEILLDDGHFSYLVRASMV